MKKLLKKIVFSFVALIVSDFTLLAESESKAEFAIGLQDGVWNAPGFTGAWTGENWSVPTKVGNSFFTTGKTAYFTNDTSVIDLDGANIVAYAFRFPYSTQENLSTVKLSNGTLAFDLFRSHDEERQFRNMTIVADAGVNLVNLQSSAGIDLIHNSHLVLKNGATLTETSSDQSTKRACIGYNAANGSSNSLYIANGGKFVSRRHLMIGGSNLETNNPTGVVTVAGTGASLEAEEIWLGYVDGNSASGGYGGLFVKDGGKVKCRRHLLMGTDYVDGNDIYRGIAEICVSGEGSVLEIGSPENNFNISMREYSSKKILVENGGRLSVQGDIKRYGDTNLNYMHSLDTIVRSGGVLEFKNVAFNNHDNTRLHLQGQGKSSFTVDGGITRALASFSTITENGDGNLHAVTVGENGWIFDTQDFDVIWKRTINFGTGTFKKIGSGYFEFNYVPTFPGIIDIAEGFVGLSGSSAKFPGGFIVRSGAAFKKTVAFSSEQSSSFTLESGATLQPYQSSATAAPVAIQAQSFSLPESGTVTIRLGDDGANALSPGAYNILTILGEGEFSQADLAKFVVKNGNAINEFHLSADRKSIVLFVGGAGAYVWTGAAGDGLFSNAANWAGGVKPVAGDATSIIFASNGGDVTNDIGNLSPMWIEFSSANGTMSISGNAFSGIAAITNLSSSAITFNAPVTFSETYRVVKNGAVVFSAGATATYPDATQRTSSSSDLNRTLSGKFTFTGDWNIPDIGNNDKPWIVQSGSEVRGKLLTGTQTSRKRILKIENDASAYFTVMTNGWSIGDIDVNGYLEIDGEVVVKTLSDQDGWSNFGTSGNTGTVKAGKFAKVDSSYVHSCIPNLIVGAGGIGSITQHWSWRFYSNTTIRTGESDFEFLGVYNSGSTSDWGVYLDANVTLTVDVGEGRTVTMGAGVYGNSGGAVRKTGAGTLVMSDTYNGQSGFTKSYTQGTTIENGTLKVLPNGMPSSGTVTFHTGTTLQLPAAGTSVGTLGTKLNVAGEGNVALKLGEGTETITKGTYSLFTVQASYDTLRRFVLANPTDGGVQSYVSCYSDGTVVLYVGDLEPQTETDCVWTGFGGDGLFSTAANWQGARRPQDVGSTAILRFNSAGGEIVNDVENLSVKSIIFGKNVTAINISGKPISGVTSISNQSSSVTPIIDAKVNFSGTITGVAKLGSSQYHVNMRGGATGTGIQNGSGGGDSSYRYFGKFEVPSGSVSGTWVTLESGTEFKVQNLNAGSYNMYINSGSKLVVSEVLTSTNWENKSSNQERFKTLKGQIICGTFKFSGTNWGTKSYLTASGNGGGVIKAGTIENDKKEGPQYIHSNGATAEWLVGAGGLKYNTKATSADAIFAINQDVTIRSYADWELQGNAYGGGKKGFRFAAAKTLKLDTADYYEKDENGNGIPRTVKLTGIITGGGKVDVIGTGAVIFNAVHEYTAHTTARDASTIIIPAAKKPGTGNVILSSTSRLFLPDAGTGTAQIGGEFTLNDGTSLVVTNISSSVTPLTVKSVSGSKAILRVEGDAPLADGEYKILSLASGNLAETVSEMFTCITGSAVEHKNVSLSVSGGNLILTVSGSYATGVCEWTGGGDGVNFSDAANWKDGVKPIAGEACIISFPAAAGALVNDIQDLTPSTIVFGDQIGAISISGEKIVGLKSIENKSKAITPVMNVRVEFAGDINYQTTAHINPSVDNVYFGAAIDFAGGATGGAIAGVGVNIMKGSFVSSGKFSATVGDIARWVITTNSSVAVTSDGVCGNTIELQIQPGASFAVADKTISASERLWCWNQGRFIVNGILKQTYDGNVFLGYTGNEFSYALNGCNTGSLWARTIILDGEGSQCLYLNNDAASETYVNTSYDIYIGEGGMQFGEKSKGAYATRIYCKTKIHPWESDFAIMAKPSGDYSVYGGDYYTNSDTEFVTTDADGETPRTITMNGVFTQNGTQAGTLTVSGAGTFIQNGGASTVNKRTGSLVVKDTATLKFGNVSAFIGTGPLTMAAGTTLAVPVVTPEKTPILLGSSFAVEGEGKVKLVVGDGTVLAPGDYAIGTVSGGIANDAIVAFELQNSVSSGTAEFYVDKGTDLRLCVGGALKRSVWTGAGDGVKFNNAANWQSKYVPVNGSELVFPVAANALVNDIDGFAPKSITFGEGVGDVAISGNAISGVLAITNLSTSGNVTFDVPVAYASGAKMEVYHGVRYDNTSADFVNRTGMVMFKGGVTGKETMDNSSGAQNIYVGHWTRTSADKWAFAKSRGGDYRHIIYDGSSLTVDSADYTKELYIGEGGAFTAATVNVALENGQRLSLRNNGEYVVTNSFTVSGSTAKDIFCGWRYANVFKFEKVKLDQTSGWTPYFACANTASTGTYYIGKGGIEFGTGNSRLGIGMDAAGDSQTIRPWYSDFTITHGSGNAGEEIHAFRDVVFCTDDEKGVGRTITLDAVVSFNKTPTFTLSGSGILVVNSTQSNDMQPPVTVKDTATLKFGGTTASISTAVHTFFAGTTLAVPQVATDAAPVSLGSGIVLPSQGQVKLIIGDGEELPEGDYPVFSVTGTLPAEYSVRFALQNPAAGNAMFYSTDSKTLRLAVGNLIHKGPSTWIGTAGDGKLSTAANWLGGKVPSSGEDIFIDASVSSTINNDLVDFTFNSITFKASSAPVTITGFEIASIVAITNLSTSSAVTFNVPVTFSDAYKIVSNGGAVKFPGGATATYPDESNRTTSSTAATRTLDGNFTFTEDWIVGSVGNDNYPWIVATGATVRGKAFTGTEERQMFQIDEGGYACFTTVHVGKTKGNISVNGTLEATESISVGVASQHSNFGRSGDKGTVIAPVIKKVDGYSVYCFIPNFIVGQGGIGAAYKDYVWQFEQDTLITASDDFEFLGVYKSSGPHDWGLGFTGKKVTVNVPEGKTVIFGISVNDSAGVLRKTGAGTLVMSDTYNGNSGFLKNYTGGTIVEEGTLVVRPKGMPTACGVTFHAGTTLAVSGSEAVSLGTSLAVAGEGKVKVRLGEGLEIADGDYPVASITSTLGLDVSKAFELVNPTQGQVKFYTNDGKTVRVMIGDDVNQGHCIWTGEAGDGLFSTAENWVLGNVPENGSSIFFKSSKACAVLNDLGELQINSITFDLGSAAVGINGAKFTGVKAITNLCSDTCHFLYAPVEFGNNGDAPIDVKLVSENAYIVFSGGVKGTKPINHTVYSGTYTLSADEWSPIANSILKGDGFIKANKISTPSTTALAIEKRATVEVNEFDAVDNSNDTRISKKNDGIFKIGTLRANRNAKSDLYFVNDTSSTGIFEINKIVQDGTWYLRLNADIAVGEGGFEFNSGDYVMCFEGKTVKPNASRVEIKSAEGKSGGYFLYSTAAVTFDTTRYGTEGEPAEYVFHRPIKHNSSSGYSQAMNITGCGKVTYLAPFAESDMKAAVNVKDNATLSIKPGCKITTGTITVSSGACLAVLESGKLDLSGGTVTLQGGANLAFNFSARNEAPLMNFKATTSIPGGTKILVTGDKNISLEHHDARWAIATNVSCDDVASLVVDEDSSKYVKRGKPFTLENGTLYVNVLKTGLRVTIR